MDLSVIIVSFNGKDRLRQCLRSVFASQTFFSYEVFVIDNHSDDGSADMVAEEFPNAKLLINHENLGYAKANNIALRAAQGRYFLLLNPDTEIAVDTFDKMISFMDNEKSIGIAGPKIIKTDGSFDKACRRNFPDIKNALFYFLGLPSRYHPDSPIDDISDVDSVMGAFLMTRASAISKIGFLDEDFFMYGEDLDWCFRAKAAGWRVVYVPISTIMHHKGSSSRRLFGKALYEFHRAMTIFYKKHYGKSHSSAFNSMVNCGIWARYYLKVLQNMFRKEKYVSK